jgi:hypothetical protein
MPSAFISYVRDNSEQVDKLAAELRQHGVTVWLDRDDILPGADWQYAIRQAIEGGDYFIACFSAEYVARRKTYMHTEIGLAIEMLQQMPIGRIWFIPVLLSDCQVPDLPIGGGRTLTRLNWEPLHKDWARGIRRILKAMGVEPKAAPVPPLAGELLVIDTPVRLELIRIPAGEFLTGNDKQRVDVAEFYIGKYPITNAQYARATKQKRTSADFSRKPALFSLIGQYGVCLTTFLLPVLSCHNYVMLPARAPHHQRPSGEILRMPLRHDLAQRHQ